MQSNLESIMLEINQTCRNQYYTSIININPSKNGTKHTLNMLPSTKKNIVMCFDFFFLKK